MPTSAAQAAELGREGLNGKMIDGRPLRVNPRTDQPGGPGPRRGELSPHVPLPIFLSTCSGPHLTHRTVSQPASQAAPF